MIHSRDGQRVRRIISFLVLVLRVNGWGKEGHYAICKNAENFFTEDALAAVKSLLPERAEGDQASDCSWADEVRRDPHYRWSSHLHYVNTPDFACNSLLEWDAELQHRSRLRPGRSREKVKLLQQALDACMKMHFTWIQEISNYNRICHLACLSLIIGTVSNDRKFVGVHMAVEQTLIADVMRVHGQ